MPRISPVYPLPISMGGTGKTNAIDALDALYGLPKASVVVEAGTSCNSFTTRYGTFWGNMTDGPEGSGWQQSIRISEYQINILFKGNNTAPTMWVRGYVNGVWQPWVKLSN